MLSVDSLSGLIFSGDKVIVGVSGGADSMCLLNLVEKYSKIVDFTFTVLHVNHNLRDAEAKRDQNFVESYCKKNSINFKAVSVDVKTYAKENGKTTEQAARELRYEAFNDALKEKKATKLLVAHNADDQAETVLMHILRGSSLKGARGMREVEKSIIRPLLNASKAEILDYVNKNKIDYVEDSTNGDVNYTRNYLRLEIIPKLKKVYPNVVSSLSTFAVKCSRDEEFIQSVLPLKLIKIDGGEATISSEIVKLNPCLSSRLIMRAFEGIGIFADIEEKHIKQVLELFDLKNGSRISLPNGVFAYKEYEAVVLSRNNKQIKTKGVPFSLGESVIRGYGKIYALDISDKQDPEFGDGNHYVDYQKVPLNAVWRTRKEGDVFAKLGAGTKKLSDYFTDKKVPKRQRESIPVLASGNNILAVAGLDISDKVKITSDTEQIIKIIYMRNDKK